MEPTPPSVEVWSLHYWIVREVPYLAMTNNTYLNIHIQVSMWTYAFIFFLSFFFFWLGRTAGSYGSLCNFKILLTLSQQGCTINIPTSKDVGSSFFTAFPTLDTVDLSNFTHFSKCVVASHCGFTVHLPNN